jgi:hypothetical protein
VAVVIDAHGAGVRQRDAAVAETVNAVGGKPRFSIRPAGPDDMDAVVEVDLKSFGSVYEGYGLGEDALRAELTEKFRGRYDKVGGGWMPVLEKDGKIVGFMTCCPTNKAPEDFRSWEETTDDGTLEDAYDPRGKNLYVVTLSVLPEGADGKDMLFANQIGKMMRQGFLQGFFESRMPGLRSWVGRELKRSGRVIADLDTQELHSYAETYFNKRSMLRGKEVRFDRLLRLYERVGCTCLKVVPDAYRDEPSLNYGVVCVYDGHELFDGSVLPVRIPQNRVTRWVAGGLMQAASKSNRLTAKMFS